MECKSSAPAAARRKERSDGLRVFASATAGAGHDRALRRAGRSFLSFPKRKRARCFHASCSVNGGSLACSACLIRRQAGGSGFDKVGDDCIVRER